jgi:LysM repeat protein
MKWTGKILRVTFAAMCCAALSGCIPSGSSGQEEEKEPHFLVGKSRVNAMDYKGAIESFEKALEVNPHSATAHFELGWLLADKESDPAAAIYHYQQYLRLRPNAENAAIVNQHIQVLRQDLAKNVLQPSLTPELQRRYEQLADENQRLKDEVERLRAAQGSAGGVQTGDSTPTPNVDRTTQTTTQTTTTPPAPARRTYKVQSGDTPSSIARKYNVKLEALMAANPGLNPTKMQVGQAVNIPTQ